jgi:hypothetical protein
VHQCHIPLQQTVCRTLKTKLKNASVINHEANLFWKVLSRYIFSVLLCVKNESVTRSLHLLAKLSLSLAAPEIMITSLFVSFLLSLTLSLPLSPLLLFVRECQYFGQTLAIGAGCCCCLDDTSLSLANFDSLSLLSISPSLSLSFSFSLSPINFFNGLHLRTTQRWPVQVQ